MAGDAFVTTGAVLACISAGLIVLGMFTGGEAVIAAGGSGITFGLLLMAVGYLKQSATAATESYQLQRRIYEEQLAATVDPAERQA